MKLIKKPALACIILLSQILGFSPLAQAAALVTDVINTATTGTGLYEKDSNLDWINVSALGQTNIISTVSMTWNEAKNTINNMNGMNGTTYKGGGWRLPSAKNVPVANCGFNTTCTSGDMGHLLWTHLVDPVSKLPNIPNLQLFSGLTGTYWTDTQNLGTRDVVAFNFSSTQDSGGTYNEQGPTTKFLVWAVRDHQVSTVPLPAAVWLFGSALLGLTGLSRKQRYSA